MRLAISCSSIVVEAGILSGTFTVAKATRISIVSSSDSLIFLLHNDSSVKKTRQCLALLYIFSCKRNWLIDMM